MFRTCELVVLNKIDLLPHVDFDVDRFLYHLNAVHPGVATLQTSARTGEGVDELRRRLAALPDRHRAGAPA
jgi:hydrogenase nickel incorporation protein HypB